MCCCYHPSFTRVITMPTQQHALQTSIPPTTLFEIKLRSSFDKEALIFTTVQPDEGAAVEQGRAILDRHEEFDFAEIWQGMKMLRQV
jgi:hypothetical protein